MALKTLVNGARDLVDESQQVVRCARIEFGPSADATKGVVFTTTGVKHLFWMPANSVILDMKHRVITAFATGQELTIGDTTSAAGMGSTGAFALATAVTTGILKANPVSAYFNATGFLGGYSVPSARYINATVTTPGATKLSTSSTGKVELFIVYSCNAED